jgi:hypothetical protein
LACHQRGVQIFEKLDAIGRPTEVVQFDENPLKEKIRLKIRRAAHGRNASDG